MPKQKTKVKEVAVEVVEKTVPKVVEKKLKKKKKKKVVVAKVTQTTATVEHQPKKNIAPEKIRPELVTFYGHSIRDTFMNNQWYFSLEDILTVASVVDPTKMLIELKNSDLMKDRYYNLVETFSYYEGDSPIIIPVVNYQNFIEILPSIRAMGYIIPGPFPDWLKNVANRQF